MALHHSPVLHPVYKVSKSMCLALSGNLQIGNYTENCLSSNSDNTLVPYFGVNLNLAICKLFFVRTTELVKLLSIFTWS